jgi:hypothetical protein
MAELRQRAWSNRFEEPLIKISGCLLDCNFDKAINIIESVIKTL